MPNRIPSQMFFCFDAISEKATIKNAAAKAKLFRLLIVLLIMLGLFSQNTSPLRSRVGFKIFVRIQAVFYKKPLAKHQDKFNHL